MSWKFKLWVDFKTESLLFLLSHQQARKEDEILFIALKKWEQLQQLTLDNSKSDEGQEDYYDKSQKLFKTMSVRAIEYEFLCFVLKRLVRELENVFNKGLNGV